MRAPSEIKASGRRSSSAAPRPTAAQPPRTKTRGMPRGRNAPSSTRSAPGQAPVACAAPCMASGGTWYNSAAASSCCGSNVRSRARCSAAASAGYEPSAIGIVSVHANASWGLSPPNQLPARGRTWIPSPGCGAPPMTTRRKIAGPPGYGENLAPASRATVARAVASMITLAQIACRPARLAITIPATCPDSSRSTSVA